jgi:uncharacterized protein YbjT (DUF2867 family)
MQDHRVRRLVCVTGVAAGNSVSGAAILKGGLAKAIAVDKARQEEQIRTSGVDWTIVRPAALTRGAGTGLYQTLTEPVAGRAKRIPRADVADFIVDNLDAPEYVRRTVFLTA